MKVHYTKRAESDLHDIAVYTLIRWGPEQWQKYSSLLQVACEEIIPRNLRYAQSVPERPGLCRWQCEQHVIFFRKVKAGIEIVRILHERMLPMGHL
ncbi:MAG: type II toxin-antitoxin system RelE/ParE family toxin [Myxococcaceae bacterium]|nr:type II toxin-antitoxin system RelE/ParE family toxin [Myxococcaceae bacterium]